jgi:transcriptional regulator with XRE-family HTH domain
MKTYRERMRELREDSDRTQRELAQILGTTQQVYSRYETGENELPLRHAVTLCRFYGVSADYFLGLSDEPGPARRR